MAESISVAASGPISRADVADLIADLQRDTDPLTWKHERRDEPDTLGPGQDIVTAVIENGAVGIIEIGAGALLDKVISTVRDWFRARRSTTGVIADITIIHDPSGDGTDVEIALGGLPANIRVRIIRSDQ
jgi:hypothetical protein